MKLEAEVPVTSYDPAHDSNYKTELTYYQWVPIILVFLAALFAIPGIYNSYFYGVNTFSGTTRTNKYRRL